MEKGVRLKRSRSQREGVELVGFGDWYLLNEESCQVDLKVVKDWEIPKRIGGQAWAWIVGLSVKGNKT